MPLYTDLLIIPSIGPFNLCINLEGATANPGTPPPPPTSRLRYVLHCITSMCGVHYWYVLHCMRVNSISAIEGVPYIIGPID